MLYFIRTVDRQLLWLNLTAAVARRVHSHSPAALLGQHADNELAVALYGINLMLVNAAGTAMWLYADSGRHLAVDGMNACLVALRRKIHVRSDPGYAAANCARALVRSLGLILFAAVPGLFHPANPFVDRAFCRSGDGGPPLPAGTSVTPEKRFDTTATRPLKSARLCGARRNIRREVGDAWLCLAGRIGCDLTVRSPRCRLAR